MTFRCIPTSMKASLHIDLHRGRLSAKRVLYDTDCISVRQCAIFLAGDYDARSAGREFSEASSP